MISVQLSVTYPPDNTPVDRADYNILGARNSGTLPMKIMYYCAALEALFSFEKSPEIAHRISERTAIFISEDLEIRKKIFNIVKRGYDVRSKVIHGNYFKKSEIEKMKELSVNLDSILRKVINREKTKVLDFTNIDNCKDYFLTELLK